MERMVYRTNAAELTREWEEDARIFAALARESPVRRRRVALVLLGACGSIFALASLVVPDPGTRSGREHCHHVQIEWENAPHVPGNGWTVCETR